MSVLRIAFDCSSIVYTGDWVRSASVGAMETTERGAIAELKFSASGIVVYGAIPPLQLGSTPESLISIIQPTLESPLLPHFQSSSFRSSSWASNHILYSVDFVPMNNATLRIVNLVGGGHLALQAIELRDDINEEGPRVFSLLPTSTSNVSTRSDTPPISSSLTTSGPTPSEFLNTEPSQNKVVIGGAIAISLGILALIIVGTTCWYFRRRGGGLTWRERTYDTPREFHQLGDISTMDTQRRVLNDKSSFTRMPSLRPKVKRSLPNLEDYSYYSNHSGLEANQTTSRGSQPPPRNPKRASGRSRVATNSSISIPSLALSNDAVRRLSTLPLSPAYNSPAGSEFGIHGH